MDIFEYNKALAELWVAGSKMFLSLQPNPPGVLFAGANPRAPETLLPQSAGLPNLSSESAELARASQSMTELWSAAAALARSLTGRLSIDGARDPTVETTFQRMLDPRAWLASTGEIDELIGNMVEGPRLADMWDVERRYARVFQAWLILRRCSLEHGAATLEGWLSAGRRFAAQMHGLSLYDAADPQALLHMWIETANRELMETQRSERFLRTQAALIRASTELKAAQRDLLEYYRDRLGFPTRTELDDVHKTVTELRRELRALQRQRRLEVERSNPGRNPRATSARNRS